MWRPRLTAGYFQWYMEGKQRLVASHMYEYLAQTVLSNVVQLQNSPLISVVYMLQYVKKRSKNKN